MLFVDLVFAFVIALVFAVLLAAVLGWRHPASGDAGVGGAVLFAFLILFFATWVGGVWVQPFGPVAWGTAWLPFVLVAIVVMLILAAVAPRRRVVVGREPEAVTAAAVFTWFFWILLLILVAALVFAYLF